MTSNTFSGTGRSGSRDGRAAGAHGEEQAVAQPEREEQLGYGERHVGLGEPDGPLGVQIGRDDHVVMQMDGPFGEARGARAVEPEGHVVFAGGRGLERGRGVRQ